MVMTTQPVEEVHGGEFGFDPVLAVVVCQTGPGCAAGCRAGWVEEVQRGFLVGVGAAAVVVDAYELLGFGQDPDDEGVAVGYEVVDDFDGDLSEACDLAQFALDGVAA